MKLYRSQKLCADVLDTVAQQIIEKEQRKEREQNEKNAYHQLVLQQIKAVEKIEERSKDRKKKMTQSIALTRSQQRDEVKLRKEQEKEEQQLVGQALQNQAKQDLIIATQHTEAEKIRIKQANELMIQYNESLKSIRSEIRKQESITQNERDGEAAVIEKRNADRKHIECVRQENRNKKRVDLVEMTTLLLQQTQQKENEMLFKQMEEIKQYQDQEDAMKLAKKKQEWDDTIRSRQLQIDRKQRDKERKRIEDDEQIQIFLRHNQQELEEDKEKIKLARDRTIAIKNQQYTDSIQSKEAKAKIKLQEKEEANILMNTNSVADDDSRFIHMCQEDIAERKQQGKTVYPLLKALTKSHKSK